MEVPSPDLLEKILAAEGPVLFVGPPDTGKSTLVSRMARAARASGAAACVLDGDVGQSEIGPPGLMDIATGETDVALSKWRVRSQWYVGATSPYGAVASSVVAGTRRLADRAAEMGLGTLLVDTASFVNAPFGHALATALVDVLRPAFIVATPFGAEMEGWLRGVTAPVVISRAEEAVRVKPSGLRATRRAARLASYFHEASGHSVRLLACPLRGTRLGLGLPLSPAERALAGTAIGCQVVHAERSSGAVALWTLAPPRHDLSRAAAELHVRRAVRFDASVWEGRSVGFIARDGSCLAMGWVERVEWPSLIATVRAPLYSVAEAVAVSAGTMRHDRDGNSLPDVPDKDA